MQLRLFAVLVLLAVALSSATAEASGMFHAETHKQIEMTGRSKINLSVKDTVATITVHQVCICKFFKTCQHFYAFFCITILIFL